MCALASTTVGVGFALPSFVASGMWVGVGETQRVSCGAEF